MNKKTKTKQKKMSKENENGHEEEEDFFRTRMTGIIHWLSCRIVAPPTLAHPFLVIIP